MTALNPEEKTLHIFNHEAKIARQLALMVLEKPAPPSGQASSPWSLFSMPKN